MKSLEKVKLLKPRLVQLQPITNTLTNTLKDGLHRYELDLAESLSMVGSVSRSLGSVRTTAKAFNPQGDCCISTTEYINSTLTKTEPKQKVCIPTNYFTKTQVEIARNRIEFDAISFDSLDQVRALLAVTDTEVGKVTSRTPRKKRNFEFPMKWVE
jgi:hypothetical protein